MRQSDGGVRRAVPKSSTEKARDKRRAETPTLDLAESRARFAAWYGWQSQESIRQHFLALLRRLPQSAPTIDANATEGLAE